MDALHLEKTGQTPLISFDAAQGKLELSGRSIPENSIGFYAPILEWLDAYAEEAQPQTTVDIQLEYFNTASSKCVLDVLKKLDAIHKSGKSEILINWIYEEEDDDMLEAGEDYEAIVDMPFKMIEVEEE